MSAAYNILLLDDEPLILMDLELAGEDRGCQTLAATNCEEAKLALAKHQAIHAAVLDVSLAEGQTCLPVAVELQQRGIPYLLHSADLDRHNERVRMLDAPLIAQPANSDEVIAAAIALYEKRDGTPASTNLN